jgi:hypothetical protein
MVMVEPSGIGMALFTLRAASDVRALQFGSAEGDLDAEMVAIAGAIISQRTGHFDPSTYRDRYQEALQQLIEAKTKGLTINYIFAFAPWMGRWKPLRVHGPLGRTPQDGIKYMIEGMKMMTRWHTDSFNCLPMGDGYEVDVNEFDFSDDNGICYDQDGVVIRHWRRAHGKEGASAYRLDWNGLSFVWTGDGRPDALTAKLSKGVDVFGNVAMSLTIKG